MTGKVDPTAYGWPVAEPARDSAGSSEVFRDPFEQDDGLKILAEGTAVAQVMSHGIVCISADASLDRVTEMLLERDIGSVPVVDAAWRPVGIISKTDLLLFVSLHSKHRAGTSGPPPPQTAGDVAQANVLSLHHAAPVSVAAAIMAYEGVHRLPVVNAAGQVIGVVSSLDIVGWVARCTNDEAVAENS